MSTEEELRKLVERYRQQLEGKAPDDKESVLSEEYLEFRKQYLSSRLNLYEQFCNTSEKFLKVTPSKQKQEVLKEAIQISHLNITPTGAYSFTIFAALLTLLFGTVFSLLWVKSFFLMFFFLILTLMELLVLNKLPEYVANTMRLKAYNQMVQCIFYIATYMRHTSNLENALEFAAEHVGPPLSLDLKKVLWDVETEKYGSLKESLDSYLETWRKWNLEFIESFHLIEASLLEPSESRRLTFIDKALEVMLQETYEKMLHYAHNLKNPITMLHMLGIILPILGLVILPLVVSFLAGVKWYHLAMLYNFILPVIVYYLGKSILSSRPTGYGDSDISDQNPELLKYRNVLITIGKLEIKIHPLIIAGLVTFVLGFIGFLPLMIHAIDPSFDIEVQGFTLLGYMPSKDNPGTIVGPYGLGATMFSLFIPLAAGLGIATYYSIRSRKVITIRNDTKSLESEFASGLFQLGNRIGDGIPIEMAFGNVAKVMQGTRSGEFFMIVSNNLTHLGMNLKQAIFNKKNGALAYFPSRVLESSMKVLMQSAKKGPSVCSQALINVSQYIKEIHRVDERLRDLLADIISSMKSQISFLAPAIAGIVVGITSMISTIIAALSRELAQMGSEIPASTGGTSMGMIDMFGDGIPPFYFQIVVGMYVVQIVYILTILSNGVENGSDKLNEQAMLGRNMRSSMLLYTGVSAAVTLMFNLVASTILSSGMI